MSIAGGTEPKHRKLRNANFIAGVFRRKHGHRSPTTPLFRWKFNQVMCSEGFERGASATVSARKLAAGLWQLRLTEVSGGDGGDRSECGAFECECLHKLQYKSIDKNARVSIPFEGKHFCGKNKDLSCSPPSVSCSNKEIICKGITLLHDSSRLHSKCSIEGATKWDADKSEASRGKPQTWNLVENGHVTINNIISSLRAELMQAQLCVKKLKAARNSTRKRIGYFLRMLEEEKNSWKNRECLKIRAVIDDLKNDIERERKMRKKIEILNSKLVNELHDAKQSEKKYIKCYEEQKHSKEIMEEVCNELAKKIGEDRIEVEGLKREALEFQEELEEEREMLQMADLWREERVHMKLDDAKITVEDKYLQMNQLMRDLQLFLRSVSTKLDAGELKKAELMQQAAKSMNIQDIKEFAYVPPLSSDMHPIIEEPLQDRADDRKIDPCLNPHASDQNTKTHIANPHEEILEKSYPYDFDISLEQQGIWDTARHGEKMNSRSYLKNCDPLFYRTYKGKRMLVGKNEENRIQELASPNTEDWEISSSPEKQLKQRISSTSHFSLSSNRRTGYVPTVSSRYGVAGETAIRSLDCVAPPSSPECILEEYDPGLFPGRGSHVGMTPLHEVSSQGGLRCAELATKHQCSMESSICNPHITRGMKGSIEWPRVVPKASLKTKPPESRIEHQKSQLHLILKHKNTVD